MPSLQDLPPETIRYIISYLIPPQDDGVFHNRTAWKTADQWDTFGFPLLLADDDATVRNARALASVCKVLWGKCRRDLKDTVRVVSEEMLKCMIEDTATLSMYRDLRLLPLHSYLPTPLLTHLLTLLPTPQLRSLSLSLLPFLRIENLYSGFHPSASPLAPLITTARRLAPRRVEIITNLMGIPPALAGWSGIEELVIEDTGFWDGGTPSDPPDLAVTQHATLTSLLSSSSSTLQRITFSQTENLRPGDYAPISFPSLLCSPTLTFPHLTHLELRNTSVPTPLFARFLLAHPNLRTLHFFPTTPTQLPPLPSSLQHLFTNCHLPALATAIPDTLQTLCAREDGSLLPPPTLDHIPALPGSLRVLHARLAPRVTAAQLGLLLFPLGLLEHLEILILPLPWLECDCDGVRDMLGNFMTYKYAWQLHEEYVPDLLGWRAELTLSTLCRIFSDMPYLRILTINHDHRLITSPFPDLHHNGPTATSRMIPEWWATHAEVYKEDVEGLFAKLGGLRVVQWRVREKEREAWMIWEKGETGVVEGRLTVDRKCVD